MLKKPRIRKQLLKSPMKKAKRLTYVDSSSGDESDSDRESLTPAGSKHLDLPDSGRLKALPELNMNSNNTIIEPFSSEAKSTGVEQAAVPEYPVQITHDSLSFSLGAQLKHKLDTVDLSYGLKINAFVIELGYYTGVHPFRWNYKSNRIFEVETKWENARWLLQIILASILRIIFFVNFWWRLLVTKTPTLQLQDVMYLLMCIVFTLSTVYDWHTIYTKIDLRILFNNFANYHDIFLFLYTQDERLKRQDKTWLLVLFIGVSSFFAVIGSIQMYLVKCELHYLAPIFQICSKTEKIVWLRIFVWNHYSIPWVFFMTIVQTFLALHIVGSYLIYLVSFAQVSCFGPEILQEFIVDETGNGNVTYDRLRTFPSWTLNYRCYQILMNELDRCISRFILPFTCAILIILNICVLFALIKINLSHIIQAFGSIIVTMLVAVYYSMIQRPSLFTIISTNILNFYGKQPMTKYQSKYFKALYPFKIRIGRMATLVKLTLVIMIDIVIVNTTTLVIVGK